MLIERMSRSVCWEFKGSDYIHNYTFVYWVRHTLFGTAKRGLGTVISAHLREGIGKGFLAQKGQA